MKRGVLLIDHGSRRSDAHDSLMAAAQLLSQQLHLCGADAVVEIAHMEIAEPTIAQGIAHCVRQGVTRLTVVPCFLSRGRHVMEDVPKLVAQAAVIHSELVVTISPPLLELAGFIPMLADAVLTLNQSE